MPKFTCEVQPDENEIRRRSDESSVTIPYDRSFRRVGGQPQQAATDMQFCGCGWPEHMLLPRGTAEGTDFDLFVMVSDYERDRIDSSSSTYVYNPEHYCRQPLWFRCRTILMPAHFSFAENGIAPRNASCDDALSFCGLKNAKYPDKRAMGFPFDRPTETVTSLAEFTQQIPNAATTNCKILFSNRILNRQ